MTSTGYFEADEPVAFVITAFKRGVKGVTTRPCHCKTCDDPIRKSQHDVWIHTDSLLSGCPEGCGGSFSVAEPKDAE